MSIPNQRGEPGERGPSGDHGQDGDRGIPGRDAPPVLSRLQTIVLFLFVILVAVVFSYRSERSDARIERNAQDIRSAVRESCERSNDNSENINSFLDLLISNARISTTLKPAEIEQRIAGYQAQKVTLLDCK